MGKRSNFIRNPRDFYATPMEAVLPLLPFLPECTRFTEPCCGDGALSEHLKAAGHIRYFASDIVTTYGVMTDALTLTIPLQRADCIITNTPWDRSILHPMLEHFRKHNRAWLLIDADWAFTKQASPYMRYCSKFVAVGRVKWIPGSKTTGKDNCAWYCFEQNPCDTTFYGR